MEKANWHFEKGQGRTKIYLTAWPVGQGLLVCLYNDNIHIGAVAVGEYDHEEKRASSSVITLRGHRDDEVAKNAAHVIARDTKKTVCAIAGIHLDNISQEEINEILENNRNIVKEFITKIHKAEI